MEKQITELILSVDHIKKTHESLKNRIEIMMPLEDQQDCNCYHDTEQLKKEISRLQSQGDVLKRIDKEQDQKHLILSEDAKGLQNRLDSIERLLLSRQMHNSKLQHFASKSNTISSTESTTTSSETKLFCAEVIPADAEQKKKKSVEDIHARVFKEASETVDMTRHEMTLKPDGFKERLALKPNFQKQPEVKQAERLVLNGDRYWRSTAQNELNRGHARFSQLKGVLSIICLDISDSMSEGNAWSQAQTFLTDYLRGLEDMSKLPNLNAEYIALVTFGKETKIQMHFTDRYSDVQKIIDNLTLGGPSQMYGGTLLAQAVAWSSTHQKDELKNGVDVLIKIVMITDGRPTEVDLIAGPDMADNSKLDETKAKILQEMERLQNSNKDVFFVPVGTADMSYLETMAAVSNGVMLTYKSGRRLARRQYLSAKLIDPVGLNSDSLTLGSDDSLSYEDKEDMRCVQKRARRHVKSGRQYPYFESNNTSLPPLGTRVRRGPDWKYSSQDSNGPGTIIGHYTDNPIVWVEWDATGNKNSYRYGVNGYDVLIVDEPRVLQTGQKMDVGCEVKPGIDWRCSEEIFEQGVVLKIDRVNKKAMVRWSNRMRGDYSYGDGGSLEIELLTQSTSQNGYAGSFQSASQHLSHDDFQTMLQNGSFHGSHSEQLFGCNQDLGRSRKSAVCDDLRVFKKSENMTIKRDKNKKRKK